MIDHPGLVVNFVTGALAHLQLACADARIGKTEAARTEYQAFLALWKDADPDSAILKQAKTEYAKLNGVPKSDATKSNLNGWSGPGFCKERDSRGKG